MDNTYNVYRIPLTSSNDCYFIAQISEIENMDMFIELETNETIEEIEAIIHINIEYIDDFFEIYPIFKNMSFMPELLDKEYIDAQKDIKTSTVNDIKDLWNIYKQYEQIYQRYIL